jgi:peptidoglycan/xylan/chitin deacetylase (PgdA/CDA1 family)
MEPALVSLTFDDGLRCQFEQAVPILGRHNFPATFFLIANTDPIHVDGHEHPDWRKTDWNENDIHFLKGMVEKGHEIGSHSVHHRFPFLDDNPTFEAEASKKWIQDRLGAEVTSYCYPFCHVTGSIKHAVINAGYHQARWGRQNSFIQRGFYDWFKVDCREVSDNENVDGWVRPGCWHVVTFHGIGGEQDGWNPISLVEFARQMAELARLRDSGAVQVVTFKDGANRLRQPSTRTTLSG